MSHSTIFCIAEQSENQYYPSLETVTEFSCIFADYVSEDVHPDAAIEEFRASSEGTLRWNDRRNFQVIHPERFFEPYYIRFKEAVERLLPIDLYDFCGSNSWQVHARIQEVENAYNDDFSVHIYMKSYGMLSFMDFLRMSKPGTVYRIVHSYDYHM